MPEAAPSSCKYILKGTAPMVDHRVEVRGDGHLVRRYRDPNRPDRAKQLSPLRQRLLDVLVGHRDRAFKSAELAATLQETFPDHGLVASSAITVHISHLRNALGDEAQDSGFIKTESGAYRLCAEVDAVDFAWPPVAEAKETPGPGGPALSGPSKDGTIQGKRRRHAVDRRPKRAALFWSRNRRLVLLGFAFAIIVPVLLLIVRQPFKVGTGKIAHNGDPFLRESAKKLPRRLRAAIEEVPPWRLYGFSNSPLDRPVRLEGELRRRDNSLFFEGTLRGLGSGCRPALRQEAPETASEALVGKLADDVALQLDWEACFHTLRLSPWDSLERNVERRAKHCLRAGRTLRQDLRYCQAKEALVMARELDPRLFGAVDLLASVYENQGDDEEALVLLRKRLQEAGGDMPEAQKKAFERRIAQLEGRIGAAIEQLEELVTLERRQNASLADGEEANWSQAQALSWFYREHEQNCEKALESLPTDHGNAALEADFLLACGDPEEAIKLYRERHEQESDSGTLYPLAHGLRLGGYAQQAREYLEELLDETPNYHKARLELARLLTDQGCLEAATDEIDELLLQLDPPEDAGSQAPPAGDQMEQRCLVDGADRSCRPRVLERDALIARALLIEAGGQDYGAALDAARAAQFARAADPKKPHRWSMHAAWAEGLVHLAAGHAERVPAVEAVLEEIKEAREAGGSLSDGHLLHHLRGRRLLAEGQADEAAGEFRQVLERYDVGQHAYFRTELATALLAAGREAEARTEIEKALDFDPKYKPALCLRAGLDEGEPARELCERQENPVCAARPSNERSVASIH